MTPMLIDQDKARLMDHGVVGQLPMNQGPNVKIEPLVKEGERMKQ